MSILMWAVFFLAAAALLIGLSYAKFRGTDSFFAFECGLLCAILGIGLLLTAGVRRFVA